MKNSKLMECIDELATQITEMNFGADTYIHQGKDNFIFRDDAQDFYNEKYDEYEELINELNYSKMGNIKKRLEELRTELRNECISYGELAELYSLVEHIDKDDVELLQAAGVPEDLS